MKKTVRIMALLLILVFTVTMFGACGKKDESDASSKAAGLSTADVNFIDSDGEPIYRIIKPEEFTDAENNAARLVFNQYKTIHNVVPKNLTDAESDDAAEIIVGNTNREETKVARESLLAAASGRDNEYIICTVSDDIVIYACSDSALGEAVAYFVNTYLINATVTGGINYVYQDASDYQNVTVFGGENLSKITIVRPIYNVSYITQQEINKMIAGVSKKTGFTWKIVNDQVASVTGSKLDGSSVLNATEDRDYEIIVGDCARDGVNKNLGKDEYEIRIEDKNIYLNGGSPKAVAMAVTEFAAIVTSKSEVTSADTVSSGDYNNAVKKHDSASYYRLTWSDDFEGDEIDENKWHIRWGETAYTAPAGEKSTYRGNKELKNNFVKEGNLYIVATETDSARYGGLLTTQGIMEYYKGYIEISTLHPRCEGVWTALYTMSAVGPDDLENVWAWTHKTDDNRIYYNETDIEECYGAGNWVYQNTFAWPTQLGRNMGISETIHVNNNFPSTDDRGFWMDFHTFGFELLDKTKITFTVDGNVSFVQELKEGGEQGAYDQPVFLRLAMAAGTANHALSTNPEDWEKYGTYIVDYIHIYQHQGDKLYTKNLKDSSWNTYIVD